MANVFAQPSFSALRAVEAGCLFAWCRLLHLSGRSTLPMAEARDFSVHFAQLNDAGFESVVSTLRSLNFISTDESSLEIVALSAAMGVQREEIERRKSGWEKRRASPGSRPSIPTKLLRPPEHNEFYEERCQSEYNESDEERRQAEHDEFYAVLPARPEFPVAASKTPAEDAAAQVVRGVNERSHSGHVGQTTFDVCDSTPTEPRAKVAQTTGVVRFGRDAMDNSSVAVIVPLMGNKVAEFTDGYAERMKALYPQVDVRIEMLRAANWCADNPTKQKTAQGIRKYMSSWLARATERQDTRAAVVATQNSRNGFGNGSAGYEKSAKPPFGSPAPHVDHGVQQASLDIEQLASDEAGLSDLLVPQAKPKPASVRSLAWSRP